MATLFSILNTFNNKIEEPVRKHLTNVYAALTASTVSAALGACLHIFDYLRGGLLTSIGAFACFILLIYTAEPDGKNTRQRMGYLMGFAALTGLGLGPLLEYTAFVDPSIIITALVGTTVVFASFSLCSLFSADGRWISFGGTLLSLLNALVLLTLANIFINSKMLFDVHLYLGLVLLCGFVLYDTQLIVNKRRMGNKDFVSHALDLFIDFVGIFRRLVVILTQKAEDNNRKRRN